VVAGATLVVPEESPNTTRQHASRKARGFGAKAPNDGKYHRKYTAPHHFGAGPATQMIGVWLDPKWCGVRLKRRGKSPPDLRVNEVA
jgi:hypothetical protein